MQFHEICSSLDIESVLFEHINDMLERFGSPGNPENRNTLLAFHQVPVIPDLNLPVIVRAIP